MQNEMTRELHALISRFSGPVLSLYIQISRENLNKCVCVCVYVGKLRRENRFDCIETRMHVGYINFSARELSR